MGNSRGRVRRRLSLRALLIAAVIAALLVPATVPAVAVSDTTPPTGSWEVWSWDNKTGTADLRFSYQDAQSGVAQLIIRCGDGPAKSYPYAAKIILDLRNPAAGGCGAGYFKDWWLRIVAVNGAGLESAEKWGHVTLAPYVDLKTPKAPVTGQPYTIKPVWPADYVLPSTASCLWEFRWGSTKALSENFLDGTFGAILFSGPKADYCKEWTFTLPWAPVAQYQVSLSWNDGTNAYRGGDASIGFWGNERGPIVASVAGTSRHFTESTIPITYVLTDKQELIVGQQVTATRYQAGGLNVSGGSWHADQSTETSTIFSQNGGMTFKFTPDKAGVWAVGWDWQGTNRMHGFYFDPLARKPGTGADTTKPLASAPQQKLPDSGAAAATVRTLLSWSGSDAGSGLAKFILQRSRNSGAWTNVTLSSLKATSMAADLAVGSSYQFRVRSVDNAGNQSDWKTGPIFKPAIVQESASAITYAGSWTKQSTTSALGGTLRTTSAATGRASYTFTGRDIAWVAQVGPGKGLVDVYIDGSLARTVDLGAASTANRRIVFSRHWAAKGTHSISLRNRATSGRPSATLDAFLVVR